MTEYLTEQEQIELLKNWIKQYSLVILGGVVIAALFIFGWRYWQQREFKLFSHASAIYDTMLTKRALNENSQAIDQANMIVSKYPTTSYSQLAAFLLAREAILKKDYQEAEKQFNWVIHNSKIPSVRQIARIRLARLMVALQKPEQGIQVLQKIDDKSFNGLTHEVQGDAYLAMKDLSMARQSYQKALAELPNALVVRPVLQMKYDDLATN